MKVWVTIKFFVVFCIITYFVTIEVPGSPGSWVGVNLRNGVGNTELNLFA